VDDGNTKDTAGKVVLERCGVGFENPMLISNDGAFLENDAHNRGAKYFVMQGHPAGWGDDRYGPFTMIVEFLIAQRRDRRGPSARGDGEIAEGMADVPVG
jgi:hypothetical protein